MRDLKDALHELYLAAGAPSLADIAGTIRMDDSLATAPKRDSIRRVLHSGQLPANPGDAEAVAVALAHMAGRDRQTAAECVRQAWSAAAVVLPFGNAVDDLLDPLALGVRSTFGFPGSPHVLPVMVPYVERQHDQLLAEVVQRAVSGHSGIVIACGEPATGKTRSCWEAVRSMPAGWRLWYPADPSDASEVLRAITCAGPNTVVWLDRIDRHLDAVREGLARSIQSEIRQVLSDRRRAPVLVVGTATRSGPLLNEELAVAGDVNVPSRTLINEAAVEVPTVFTIAEQHALGKLAGQDPRLALAQAEARGAVAQYLSTDRTDAVPHKASTFHDAVVEGDVDTLLVGAVLLENAGRTTEAATWYQAAAEAGETQALQPAASLLSQNGSLSDAISWLHQRAGEGDVNAALEAARRLRNDGQNREAITLYQRAAQSDSEGQALRAAASLLRRSGRSKEAFEWLRERAEAGDSRAFKEAAHVLWSMGERGSALAYYEQAAASGDVSALREVADLLRAGNETERAIHWYRRAVDSGDYLGLNPLADLLRAEGCLDEALHYYLLAAEELSDVVAMRLAATLLRLGNRPVAALTWYMNAATAGDHAALVHIAALHRDAGEVDTALTWYTKAADHHERDAYREAVWMLWEVGRLDDALEWLQRRTVSGDRQAVREMADLLRETGRLTEALAWYERSAEEGSTYSAQHAATLRRLLENS
ncbi:tetratricopeptide repeat protein [Kitasatospora sp. NPDC058218]|uniref:tetratricopeptide repeat protein n=1 Tax=Kitasatospora sp. NPDC058218 TaxID=3346385 RepID=UPI0036D87A72